MCHRGGGVRAGRGAQLGCTWQRGSRGRGSRGTGRPRAARFSAPPSTPAGDRTGCGAGPGGGAGAGRWQGRPAGRPGELLPPSSPGRFPRGHVTFLGGDRGGSGTPLLRASYAQIMPPVSPAASGAAAAEPLLPAGPLCAPLALPLRAGSPSEGGCSPSYLCPRRSGSLLVPRPQSPFDPLLGSEPCDPVGGPHSQAAGAADSAAGVSPRSLCSLQPGAAGRGPQVSWPLGSPGWRGGRARSGVAPGPPPCLDPSWPAGQLPSPWRGTAGARSPRGAQIFGLGVEEKGFVWPQPSLCKCLASRAEWCGPPPAGVSWRSQFPSRTGLP